MELSISKTAQLCSVSVRTLHYYDEIGLVKPSKVCENGYRFYNDDDISLLQQVIFYRELDLPLKEIAEIINDPGYNKIKALESHRELLMLQKSHIDSLINLVNETIGDKIMSKPKTTLEDIQNAKKKYAAEVRERWGNTAEYKQSEEKNFTAGDEINEAQKADEIFSEFSKHIGDDPSCDEVQDLVKKWQAHISEFYYECSKTILAGLGEMYVGDERFTQNLDRFGKGTAQLMSDAIKIYCAE